MEISCTPKNFNLGGSNWVHRAFAANCGTEVKLEQDRDVANAVFKTDARKTGWRFPRLLTGGISTTPTVAILPYCNRALPPKRQGTSALYTSWLNLSGSGSLVNFPRAAKSCCVLPLLWELGWPKESGWALCLEQTKLGKSGLSTVLVWVVSLMKPWLNVPQWVRSF